MKAFEGRNLLVGGVLVEILLIGALMATDSSRWLDAHTLSCRLDRYGAFYRLGNLAGGNRAGPFSGKIMGLYNTALALSFSAARPYPLLYRGNRGNPFLWLQ